MSQTQSQTGITSALQENRVFPPKPEFSSKAHIKSRAEYDKLYRESIDQPDTFWSRIANELHWFKKWDKVLDWKLPYAKWFVGGKTNVSYNCLDRQIELGRGNKTAILWEGEPKVSKEYESPSELSTDQKLAEPTSYEVRKITYKQLKDQVCQFANGLKKLWV